MAKPQTYLGANLVLSDQFTTWFNKTNQLIYEMGTSVMTVAPVDQPDDVVGGLATGNTQIEGTFSATLVAAGGALRGGTVSVPAALNVTSNATFRASTTFVHANLVTGNTAASVFNTAALSVNAFGAATTLTVGASGGTLTLRPGTVVGAVATQNLYNTVATTLNLAGGATAINMGAASGITTIRNNLVVNGSFTVAGRTVNISGGITTANNFSTTGNFPMTLNATANTVVTVPTAGTLISSSENNAGMTADYTHTDGFSRYGPSSHIYFGLGNEVQFVYDDPDDKLKINLAAGNRIQIGYPGVSPITITRDGEISAAYLGSTGTVYSGGNVEAGGLVSRGGLSVAGSAYVANGLTSPGNVQGGGLISTGSASVAGTVLANSIDAQYIVSRGASDSARFRGPSAIAGWVNGSGGGGKFADYNCSSAQDVGVGQIQVNWGGAIGSANPAVYANATNGCFAIIGGPGNNGVLLTFRNVNGVDVDVATFTCGSHV